MIQKGSGAGGIGRTDLIGNVYKDCPDTQLLFIGAVNCLRHKPFNGIAALMKEKKAALLCPTMTDFATGRYLHQVEEAAVELAEERDTKHIALIYGCQWVVLSSDGELLAQKLLEEHGIELRLLDDSHLEYGDHA